MTRPRNLALLRVANLGDAFPRSYGNSSPEHTFCDVGIHSQTESRDFASRCGPIGSYSIAVEYSVFFHTVKIASPTFAINKGDGSKLEETGALDKPPRMTGATCYA